jgi:hypothetical protein
MPFEWWDFFELAEELSKSPASEAGARTQLAAITTPAITSQSLDLDFNTRSFGTPSRIMRILATDRWEFRATA